MHEVTANKEEQKHEKILLDLKDCIRHLKNLASQKSQQRFYSVHLIIFEEQSANC